MAKKKKKSPQNQVWTRYAWWAVPILACLLYLPVFNADFTLDDILIVEENTYVHSLSKIPDIWTSHYWKGKIDATDTGLYRPLTLTSYNLQHAIFGASPGPYHIFNIILHALVCLVLMQMVKLIFRDENTALLSGLIYAIHPVHAEAVAGIVGRAELLAALFILTASVSYHHWRIQGQSKWLIALVISTFAAITSKEHGFMIPVILALQEAYYYIADKKYHWPGRRNGLAFGLSGLACIILWFVRDAVTGHTLDHEMWRGVSSADRMATAIRTTAEYVSLHIWPVTLSADYWTDLVPIAGFGNWKVLLSLTVLCIMTAVAFYFRKRLPVAAWGFYFFLLTLLPVSNFLFAAGFLKAERILYIPSIGLIIAMAALLTRLAAVRHGRVLSLLTISIVVVFLSVRTYIRAGDWKNNFTLSTATLKVSPNNPRFNNMMGIELRAQKKNKEALLSFERSVESYPGHIPALVNLGTEYRNFGRHQEAAVMLERALALDPNSHATYVNLMSVYRSMNDFDKNVEVAEKALARYPQSAAVIWNAANAYQLKGNMAKANALRAKALEIDPKIGGGK